MSCSVIKNQHDARSKKYEMSIVQDDGIFEIIVFLIVFYSNDIDLEGRLEYLSRAIMTAKSCNVRQPSISDGEFLHELEEKLEA